MSSEPTKVLYIAGVPHSGTTVISQILGQLDGVVSVGELYYLSAAFENGDRCGCGELVRECPFWTAVLSAAGVAAETLRPDRYYMAIRELPAVLLRPRAVPSPAYRGALSAVVREAAAAARSRVVVDSSKSPTVGRILDATPGVDLHVLHVVRSPAASGYSRARVNPRYRTLTHALLWDSWNAAIELLWGRRPARYLRLRYEDFAERPQEAIGAIAALIGENQAASPFSTSGSVAIEPTHNVAGNQMRFSTGTIAIRRDDAWLTQSPPGDRRTIERLSWPLRLRYGYGAGASTPR